MTNEIKGGDAYELSTDINVITAEINAYQRVAGEAIFEIGKRLKYVKENDLAYGGFGEWTESIGMDARRASEFITVFEQLAGEDFRTYGKMGMNALYLIATMPEESRTESHTIPSTGEEKTVDEMTVRELREVKRELKKTQEERDAERKEREEAEAAKLQAEQRAEQAQRSEELAIQKLEEFEDGEPEVEIRTEYVEVIKKDESLEHRLQEYEERFGAIENYSERPRATNLAEVTTSVMTFSKAVRDLAKRHAYLIQYQGTISALDPVTKREYNEAVQALADLTKDFGAVDEEATVIIDAQYTEQ